MSTRVPSIRLQFRLMWREVHETSSVRTQLYRILRRYLCLYNCKVKYSNLVNSVSRASDSEEASSVDNWNGYAKGGQKQHDVELREKLRQMDRLAEQEPHGLRDKFLNQLVNRTGAPTLREALALQTPNAKPSSSKINLAPIYATSMAISPLKSFIG
jgi:hypothetical protein